MFTAIVVSINGGESRMRGEFTSPALVQEYIKRALTNVTSYWQVWIENSDGERVVRGVRDGYNGTGKNWTWSRVP